MILLLGSNGQLGTGVALELAKRKYDFFAADYNTLNIAKEEEVNAFISFLKPKVIINAAAYTDVNKAERQREVADLINNKAVENIWKACVNNFDEEEQPTIIHYSTDYVFDGIKSDENLGYLESDVTNPLSYYGLSKRNGEVTLVKNYKRSVIIRTSWLFSEHGNNFIKTIANKLVESSSDPVTIVNDQFGSPTSARSLAGLSALITDKIVGDKNFKDNSKNLEREGRYGIYHFSGSGKISWFDFGNAIRSYCKLFTNAPLRVIKSQTSDPQALVKRPNNSVMNCEKIKSWLKLSDRYFNWGKDCHDLVQTVFKK
jgi:dTDP-4-dehydrorhamnose reductase|tara:strand:+ start:9152 stop:10096 length:945 start_codon:yes stop_codon:yes gene_type:complete